MQALLRSTLCSARPSMVSASPAPYTSAVSTVSIPFPGVISAWKRSSSIASPKCMKRPPLQVPTATRPGWRAASAVAMARSLVSADTAEVRRRSQVTTPTARAIQLMMNDLVTHRTDASLLAASDRDPDAFAELYGRYAQRIHAYFL